ncbi:MAG: hypothetical protein IJB80_05660 [Clostridia bacterium]|nr:hypothetical protein [Clostridia bacterium]
MKDRQSKKVVIIHDIDSQSIEKAILILRSNGTATPAPANYHIVSEAERIIRAYSKTVEKADSANKEKSHTARRLALGAGIFLSVFSIGYYLIRCAQMLLEKF